jgi:hypothetical protein
MGIIEMMTCAAGEIIFSIFTFTPERPQFSHAEYDTKKKQKLQTKKNNPVRLNPVRFDSIQSDFFVRKKFSVKKIRFSSGRKIIPRKNFLRGIFNFIFKFFPPFFSAQSFQRGRMGGIL